MTVHIAMLTARVLNLHGVSRRRPNDSPYIYALAEGRFHVFSNYASSSVFVYVEVALGAAYSYNSSQA